MQTLHLVSVFAFSTTPNRQSICNKKALARKRQPTKEADGVTTAENFMTDSHFYPKADGKAFYVGCYR
jgi:hypothetical protein